jgi:hypothetical protein
MKERTWAAKSARLPPRELMHLGISKLCITMAASLREMPPSERLDNARFELGVEGRVEGREAGREWEDDIDDEVRLCRFCDCWLWCWDGSRERLVRAD